MDLGPARTRSSGARDWCLRLLDPRASPGAECRQTSRYPRGGELSDKIEITLGKLSIGTMHLAKGLKFRTVAVMACDDEIIPSQQRIENVADEAVRRAPAGRLYGLKAAIPDAGGLLDREGLSAGTSAAAALATRAAHRLFDALMDETGGSLLADVDPVYHAVFIKALLVHRAQWGDKGILLDTLYGPQGKGKHLLAATISRGRSATAGLS